MCQMYEYRMHLCGFVQRGKSADKGKGKFSEQEVETMQDVD